MDVHVQRYFFEFLFEVDCLEVTVTQKFLIELLFVDGPHLLKTISEVLFEECSNVFTPEIVFLGAKTSQQLLKYFLQIANVRFTSILPYSRGSHCIHGFLEHAVDVLKVCLVTNTR